MNGKSPLETLPPPLAVLYVLLILALYIAPVVLGVRVAKARGRSPHWMWFGLHPVSGWIAYFWLRSSRPVGERAAVVPVPKSDAHPLPGGVQAVGPPEETGGRVTVGECAACHRPLRSRSGARPNLRLTCRCGHVTMVNEQANPAKRPGRQRVIARLRRFEGDFAGLRREHPRTADVVFLGGSGEGGAAGTLAVISGVCADAARALETGLDPAGLRIEPGRVADGLRRLVADARKDTGLVATALDPDGVRAYQGLLVELERVAGDVSDS